MIIDNQYNQLLHQVIAEIKSTRITLARRVNTSMMQMYWNIGERLSKEGIEKGYGSSVVKRLSSDLQQEFPETTGFSPRNLWNMKLFYEFYASANEKLITDTYTGDDNSSIDQNDNRLKWQKQLPKASR